MEMPTLKFDHELFFIYIHKQLNRQNFYLISRLESIRSTEKNDKMYMSRVHGATLEIDMQSRFRFVISTNE